MNLVERWFADLTSKWLNPGTHRSTKDLRPPSPTGSTPGTKNPGPCTRAQTTSLRRLASFCARTAPTQLTRACGNVFSRPCAARIAAAKGSKAPWSDCAGCAVGRHVAWADRDVSIKSPFCPTLG